MHCHKCIHVGDVPGSCHSCCKHPDAQSSAILVLSLAVIEVASENYDKLRKAKVETLPIIANSNGCDKKIIASVHGMANGWCMWPMNFDPIWIKRCPLYERKDVML